VNGRRRAARLTRRLGAVAAALLVAAGCGVGTEEDPRGISRERVPQELNAPPPAPPTTDRPDAVAFNVFLVRGERLAPVPRALIGRLTVGQRLDTLLAGPSTEEAASGYRSSISEGTRLVVTSVTGSIAVVEVSTELTSIGGAEQVMAVAQVVYTVTEAPEVSEVSFTVEGRPAGAPTRDGTVDDRPVRREDYAGLR